MTIDVIEKAVDMSIDKGVPKWCFCRGILNTWITSGIKTIDQANVYESRRKKTGDNKPKAEDTYEAFKARTEAMKSDGTTNF